MTVLKINNVTKKFDNHTVVDQLSLDLEKGEVLGLIGQNGAGKSTTFKMILNFLKPDSGSIYFNDHQLSYKDLDNVGFLPEERGVYEEQKISVGIKYMAKLHGYYESDIDDKIDFWMEKLQVKGKKNDRIKTLSKGNQQKVQLISSFIHEPKLLILDEPFSGLDPVNSDLLITSIEYIRNKGAAIIFSSHDMRNVNLLSDKIMMLKNGKTILNGKTNTIRSNFGKKILYIEGNFKNSDFMNLNAKQDDEGFMITFDNEQEAKLFLEKQLKQRIVTGYRLQTPTLDDIFRQIILSK
ncbi:ABC transporter ATP-binding protein [Leuconostoc inhae]|uniref:ABC transporter ATP-binding protein n=1 Tax=Leuconostoc inhae TaxID=178001 RepID=UPI001C7DB924|nr:ATP-binding cassette domain-containing protein [Leuconostoc inhae]